VAVQFDSQTPGFAVWRHSQLLLRNNAGSTGVAIAHDTLPISAALGWEGHAQIFHDSTLVALTYPLECCIHVHWLGIPLDHSGSKQFLDLWPGILDTRKQKSTHRGNVLCKRGLSNHWLNARLLKIYQRDGTCYFIFPPLS